MTDYKGYSITRRKGRSHWAPLCEEWLLLIERYSRVESGDAAYWFNEMADVAVLAGAAWRCGWISVVESQSEKGARHRPKHWGRADLYIANHDFGEYIEAKHVSFSMNSRREIENIIEKEIESATKDARSTSGKDKFSATGVCFFAPYITAAAAGTSDELDEKIYNLVEIVSTYKSHIRAWCFPEISRGTTTSTENESGYLWPGTFLLANNPDI